MNVEEFDRKSKEYAEDNEKSYQAGFDAANQYVPYQVCPKCIGQGIVSKPPYVAGDVHSWASTSMSFTCDVCNGSKVIIMAKANHNKYSDQDIQNLINHLGKHTLGHYDPISAIMDWLKEYNQNKQA